MKGKIFCSKCGNGTFNIMESENNELYVGCDRCGKGHAFGKSLYSVDVLSIIKGETDTVIYKIK